MTEAEAEVKASARPKNPVTVIGISGPSSSGKTTLARLLQRIFSHISENLQTFIMHEDDFYLPDDRIPYTTTSSGKTVQDWDTVEAIDVPFMASALSYVRQHGRLPPRLKSKEDLNEASDSGVSDETIAQLQRQVSEKLQQVGPVLVGDGEKRTVVFFEGFLLFSPPEAEVREHVLRPVHEQIDVRLFLPAPYDYVKNRRERRSGYVTIGPAPVPPLPHRGSSASDDVKQHVDLEAEDDAPPQNFWTDPPGYVDDIVWPRYVRDHAWLLLPESGLDNDRYQNARNSDIDELVRIVGQGTNVRTDAGVAVAPGKGALPMADVLKWAIEEVMKPLEMAER
ncbi:nicotinamide riboside kinase [Aspergillus udagawae]|uniref:Nicotinamide riboside kinase n=1 Tax=Aspergillus udagawae TaxID=91492 RepID=A0A8E0QXZ5_9EURO|nr:ribosylnicotinamide kinase [Aspergillus udagawae]GFF26961.1 nicotinamide riboside kinase [Aspergillus udagawae]GFF37227.1 nicotinamide riboside kinase [Aspergillus udagawae]GFG02804.1 nicotinamide riboside kinase [Aspergillus udagawae]GIC90818.1 ribosylnicotinamide kinase [Aspergillus udagawae]